MSGTTLRLQYTPSLAGTEHINCSIFNPHSPGYLSDVIMASVLFGIDIH